MAKHAIFITDFVLKASVTDDYWYSYQEEEGKGILRVYKQKELIYEDKADVGEGFYLVMNQKGEYLKPITLSEKREELVACLLGFDKRERATMYEDYVDLLEERRTICTEPGYVEKITAGPNFEFAKYSVISEEGCAYHALACWVDTGISNEEILYLIPEFVYPKAYLRKVLHENLGISIKALDRTLSMFAVR